MEDRLSAALRLHQSGRPFDAEPIYHDVLADDPRDLQARQLLAVLAVQTGRPAVAVELLTEGARLHPESVEIWCNLGGALGTATRHQDAARCFHRAAALAPDNIPALFNRGNAVLRDNRAAEAERLYRRVLRLDPAHAAAQARLTGLRTQWGARLAAAQRCEAASRRGQILHSIAAQAWLAVGDERAAEAATRRAVAADPGDAGAQYLLGDLLIDRCGLRDVAAGRPFAVDRSLAEEALRYLACAAMAAAAHPDAGRVWFSALALLTKIGLASDAALASAAPAAWRRLRAAPKDVDAAQIVGFYVYRRGRLDLAAALNRRFQARFTDDEVVERHELGIWAMLRADDDFFAGLDSGDAAAARLPPWEIAFELSADSQDATATDGPVIMFSCDDVYFRRFGPAMLESLATRMPGAAVVAHVVSPTDEGLRLLTAWRGDGRLNFGCSVERPDFAGWTDIKRISYYAAGRFVRAYQWLRRLNRPLIVLDVDAVVRTDLRELRGDMAGYDLALLMDPRGRGPSREATVCFNYYNNTPAGLAYLSQVAAYIEWFMRRDRVYWLLDQSAHYAVYWRMNQAGELAMRSYDFLNFPYCGFIGAK